jgi:basic amino acid/polyamine antiporter, APA family
MLLPMPDQPAPPPTATNVLRPVLGLPTAVAIVVGEVIGAGIFLLPREVVSYIGGYVGLILALWVIVGLINLCGALTLGELSAMFPHAGGTYVFLREAYGRPVAFLWGWAEFCVIRSGSVAALSVALTISLMALVRGAGYQLTTSEEKLLESSVAIGVIIVLTIVNILGTRWGGVVQIVTAAIKAGFVGFLAVLPFIALRSATIDLSPLWPASSSPLLWIGIGGALAKIMFAYDGWGNVTVVAEDLRNPQRNIPLALAGGVLLLILLYTGANLAYHLTLSSTEIAAAPVPAVAAAEKLLPGWGAKLTLSMMMVSVFGALNGNILAGPRVLYAIGRDFPALKALSRIDPRFGTPALATGIISSWAVLLVLAGDLSPNPDKRLFEVLVDYAIFGGSLFYLAAVVSVFVFRNRRPDAPRPYRTTGYPVVPTIFVLFYLFLLWGMFRAAPLECGMSFIVIATGAIPLAIAVRRGRRLEGDTRG